MMVSTTITATTSGALRQCSSSASLAARRLAVLGTNNSQTDSFHPRGWKNSAARSTPNIPRIRKPEPGESPVRDRIRLFEKINHSAKAGEEDLAKGPEHRTVSPEKPLGPALMTNSQGRVPDPRARRQRSFSFKGRWRLRKTTGENNAPRQVSKSKIPIFKRSNHSRSGTPSPSDPARPKRTPSFSFRAAFRKISNPKSRPSREVRVPPASLINTSCGTTTELLDKTSHITPRSTLPLPKSPHPIAINSKHPNHDTPRKPSTLKKPPPIQPENQPPWARACANHSGHSHSLGLALGDAYKKTPAAKPIVSPARAHAHAHDITCASPSTIKTNPPTARFANHLAGAARQSQQHPQSQQQETQGRDEKGKEDGSAHPDPRTGISKSWGRRAAAVALEMSRRLPGSFMGQARRVSGSLEGSFRGRVGEGASAGAGADAEGHGKQGASVIPKTPVLENKTNILRPTPPPSTPNRPQMHQGRRE
ncbi:hypothetical protein VTJ49DRAFT_1301 [Mycothermus thermophilus]|uniref:Uncharacterized protein n=1 Tax=Humicola insolens TaxID=85995 RepID=A0ABR3VCP9_HUMIN